MKDKKRILIGEIATAHGIKGYVKVRSFVEDETLLESDSVYVDATSDKTISLTLKNALKGDWVAHVKGVDDRNAAELLRGTPLYLDRQALPEIDDGEFYIEDLKGLRVVDAHGHDIGTIINVENFGAGDLLDIKPPSGQSFYISFTDDTIVDINMDDGTLTINMPEVI